MAIDLTPLSKKEATKHTRQHFILTGVMPKEKNGYGKTVRISCAVHTIDDALALARKKHPLLVIYSVNHQGPIEYED